MSLLRRLPGGFHGEPVSVGGAAGGDIRLEAFKRRDRGLKPHGAVIAGPLSGENSLIGVVAPPRRCHDRGARARAAP